MNIISSNNPSIPTRRYLAATIIPLALFYVSILFLINNINNQYEFTQKEIIGVSVISQLHNSIVNLQKIRGLSGITLKESTKISQEVKTLQYDFNDTFRRLTYDENLEKVLSLSELTDVKDKVNQLFGKDLFSVNRDVLFSEYTDFIALLKQNIRIAADRSNLTLDPELDSYYMMSLMTIQFPEIIELLGRVRGKGSALISGANYSDEERGQLLGHLAVLQVGLESLKNTGSIIYTASPELEKNLHKLIITAELKAALFIYDTKKAISGTSPLSSLEYFNLGTDAIKSYLTPYRMIGELLTKRLHERAHRLHKLRNISISGTLLAAILIIYFAHSFYKSNKVMFERIQTLSITDMLTGLYNRRYMQMVMEQELNRVHRERKSFSLAIIDVDFFKPFNDNYGHLEGDRALVEVAQALKENLKRAGDFVFRIGGEEFCFFFSGESKENTLKIADEIRHTIEKMSINHDMSSISQFLTISIGIAYIDKIYDKPHGELMKNADEALYKAKLSGRNRCEMIQL